MNIDKVAIGNMALANIGAKPVQNFNQPDVASRALALRYDEARLMCLNAQLWNFASMWVAGTPVAITPKPGWTNVWAYPPDALRVFEIWRPTKEDKEIPFEVTDRPDAPGKLIHTLVTSPVFVYCRDKEDPTTFDWDFITAFSWLLASLIAMPVTKSVKIQDNAAKKFASMIDIATARTKNEGKVDTDIEASYQAAR